jgi:hypothetical protein
MGEVPHALRRTKTNASFITARISTPYERFANGREHLASARVVDHPICVKSAARALV